MKKFMVVSGFLGAGKTTTMIALSKEINSRGQKSSIIANDPGAKNLVDRLRRLLDYEKNDFVMSDIPGCGVGALDHVYFKLNAEYHGEFDLAPFTVVADWRPT